MFIVLDNFESLLQNGNSLGTYRTGYEAYGQLLRQVEEESHQSCLLFSSREKPKGFATKKDKYLSIRSLYLKGLQPAEVRQLLDKKGVYAYFEDI